MKIIERCKDDGSITHPLTRIEDYIEDYCGLTPQFDRESTLNRIRNVAGIVSNLLTVLSEKGLVDNKDMEAIFTPDYEYEIVLDNEFADTIE